MKTKTNVTVPVSDYELSTSCILLGKYQSSKTTLKKMYPSFFENEFFVFPIL